MTTTWKSVHSVSFSDGNQKYVELVEGKNPGSEKPFYFSRVSKIIGKFHEGISCTPKVLASIGLWIEGGHLEDGQVERFKEGALKTILLYRDEDSYIISSSSPRRSGTVRIVYEEQEKFVSEAAKIAQLAQQKPSPHA